MNKMNGLNIVDTNNNDNLSSRRLQTKVVHLYNVEQFGCYGIDYSESSTKGVITFCSAPFLDFDIFDYGVAICSPGDNFCKKTGIDIAMIRMNSSDFQLGSSFVYLKEKWVFQEIKLAMLVNCLSILSDQMPLWAIKTIRNEIVITSRKLLKS